MSVIFSPFFANIAEFGIQLQLAYTQQPCLTEEQKDLAGMLGVNRTRGERHCLKRRRPDSAVSRRKTSSGALE